MRGFRVATVVTLLVGAMVTVSGADAATTGPPAAPSARDRDGDRVVDSLESDLAAAGAEERTPVLVVFDGDRPPAGLAAKRTLRHARAVVSTMTRAEVRAAARLPGVRHVEADAEMKPAEVAQPGTTPDGTLRPSSVWSWATPIQLEPAGPWAATTLGLDGDAAGDGAKAYGPDDMVIAVVDTGIDALERGLDEGKVIHAEDFADERDPSCGPAPGPSASADERGHGTPVAEIVANDGDIGIYRGMAPAAALVDLKVFDCLPLTSTSRVAAALEWLLDHHAEHGVDIVNMSLGSSEPSDGTDVVSRLVNQLTAEGVVVVTSAGNAGPRPRTIGTRHRRPTS